MSDNPYKDQVKRYKSIKRQTETLQKTVALMSDCYVAHGQNKHADFLFEIYKILEGFQQSMQVFRMHMMEGDKSQCQPQFLADSPNTPKPNLPNCKPSLEKDLDPNKQIISSKLRPL